MDPKTKGFEILLCRAGALLPLNHPSPPIFNELHLLDAALGANGKTSQVFFGKKKTQKKPKQNKNTKKTPPYGERGREGGRKYSPCVRVVMLQLIYWYEIP